MSRASVVLSPVSCCLLLTVSVCVRSACFVVLFSSSPPACAPLWTRSCRNATRLQSSTLERVPSSLLLRRLDLDVVVKSTFSLRSSVEGSARTPPLYYAGMFDPYGGGIIEEENKATPERRPLAAQRRVEYEFSIEVPEDYHRCRLDLFVSAINIYTHTLKPIFMSPLGGMEDPRCPSPTAPTLFIDVGKVEAAVMRSSRLPPVNIPRRRVVAECILRGGVRVAGHVERDKAALVQAGEEVVVRVRNPSLLTLAGQGNDLDQESTDQRFGGADYWDDWGFVQDNRLPPATTLTDTLTRLSYREYERLIVEAENGEKKDRTTRSIWGDEMFTTPEFCNNTTSSSSFSSSFSSSILPSSLTPDWHSMQEPNIYHSSAFLLSQLFNRVVTTQGHGGRAAMSECCPPSAVLGMALMSAQTVAGQTEKLQVIYEDDAMLVLNKPPGLAMHPAPPALCRGGTVVHELIRYHHHQRMNMAEEDVVAKEKGFFDEFNLIEMGELIRRYAEVTGVRREDQVRQAGHGVVAEENKSKEESPSCSQSCCYISLSGSPFLFHPGIVHRLDKATSGVVVTAKTKRSYVALKQAFAERRVFKEYAALGLGGTGGQPVEVRIRDEEDGPSELENDDQDLVWGSQGRRKVAPLHVEAAPLFGPGVSRTEVWQNDQRVRRWNMGITLDASGRPQCAGSGGIAPGSILRGSPAIRSQLWPVFRGDQREIVNAAIGRSPVDKVKMLAFRKEMEDEWMGGGEEEEGERYDQLERRRKQIVSLSQALDEQRAALKKLRQRRNMELGEEQEDTSEDIRLLNQSIANLSAELDTLQNQQPAIVQLPAPPTTKSPEGGHDLPIHGPQGLPPVVPMSGATVAAQTRITTVCGNCKVSLCRAQLMTGRTHQVRVHMAARGTPVLGDDIYGSRRWNRQLRCYVREQFEGRGGWEGAWFLGIRADRIQKERRKKRGRRLGGSIPQKTAEQREADRVARLRFEEQERVSDYLMLHAYAVELEHPEQPGRLMRFTATLPTQKTNVFHAVAGTEGEKAFPYLFPKSVADPRSGVAGKDELEAVRGPWGRWSSRVLR